MYVYVLTSSTPRQLGQSQNRIVTRHILKRDIAMPRLLDALPLVRVRKILLVIFLRALRANNADLLVVAAMLALRVQDRMDVQA